MQFPAVAEACARNGIDPAKDPIPVAAAAHYHMGGIATDHGGRATLGGLWVCGEASSTGLHGANRLASNGLLEALVYARICAEDIAASIKIASRADPVDLHFIPGGLAPDAGAVTTLRETMTNNVGVVRTADGLCAALATIAKLEAEHSDSRAFLNMCATATLIAASALIREESRGAHERADFPDTLPGPGQRSKMTLTEALAIRAEAIKDLT